MSYTLSVAKTVEERCQAGAVRRATASPARSRSAQCPDSGPAGVRPRPRAVYAKASFYMTVIMHTHQATPPHLAAPSASKTTKKEKYPERDASARA
jgi:hypothetical protein